MNQEKQIEENQTFRQGHELSQENFLSKPVVFQYEDYRLFLHDFYSWRKRLGPYSYKAFSEYAGFKARSFLKLVISGKRNLTAKSLEKVIQAVELNADEAQALSLLVKYNQATDPVARDHFGELFSKLHKQNRPCDGLTPQPHPVFENLNQAIVYVLLMQPNMDQSPAALADLTDRTEAEISQTIDSLIRLGFVQRRPSQSGHILNPVTNIKEEIPKDALKASYQYLLRKVSEPDESPTALE